MLQRSVSTHHRYRYRHTVQLTDIHGQGHPETKAGNPETKILDHDAPYKHAPPKDGDPWTTVLTPELEADTVRCTAWKEEVQNLLIFVSQLTTP
jgi:hypothetical protein